MGLEGGVLVATLLRGDYRDGLVTLRDKPRGVLEGRVHVLLVPASGDQTEPRMLAHGKYRGGRMSTPEDFLEAEWHGDEVIGD